MGINWSELFPTKLSIFIFICYMSLFVNQGIIVTASQEENNTYKYNTVTVVLLTEIVKLIVSVVLYCKEETFISLLRNIKKDANVLLLYFVPAFLYCLYNNLAFTNLSTFDPTTYYLLLQFRVVITGVLFQIIFKKYLSKRQWFSLILLTVGCMLKQFNFGYENSTKNVTKLGLSEKNMTGFTFSISAAFILVQTVSSCLAGVYNEYLLKDKGANVNIYVQNVFMYLDSIICNSVILFMKGEFIDAFTKDSLSSIFRYYVLIIIINNAAIGIITSFFLKYMNSILKTFASALELVFTAVFSYVLFSIPIYVNTVLAIGVVSFSIYLYSQNPVVNLGKNGISQKSDNEKLLSSDNEDDGQV